MVAKENVCPRNPDPPFRSERKRKLVSRNRKTNKRDGWKQKSVEANPGLEMEMKIRISRAFNLVRNSCPSSGSIEPAKEFASINLV
jgi:hypothetical protein